jgi:hypothetical protein
MEEKSEDSWLRIKNMQYCCLRIIVAAGNYRVGADLVRLDGTRFMRGDKPYYFCGDNIFCCYLTDFIFLVTTSNNSLATGDSGFTLTIVSAISLA